MSNKPFAARAMKLSLLVSGENLSDFQKDKLYIVYRCMSVLKLPAATNDIRSAGITLGFGFE